MKLRNIILCLIFFLNALFAQQKTALELDYQIRKLPFGLEAKKSTYIPDITVVLSGGGSRGLCQVGVLKAFEEHNISFNSIVGTSMGSIIGGLYASGYSIEDLEKVGLSPEWKSFTTSGKTKRSDLFVDQKIAEDKAFLTLRLDGLKPVIPNSLNTGKGIGAFLNTLAFRAPILMEDDFSRLIYNYKAVATDLIKGKPVVLKRGSLVKAMRASSSVSLLLPPVRIDTLLLADGGLVSNIPVEIALKDKPDFIIAVNTTSPLRTEEELRFPWNVADQIVSIPILVNNRRNIEKADYLLEPDLGIQNGMDFSNPDSLIIKGYEAAKKEITSLKDKIRNRGIELSYQNKTTELEVKFSGLLNREEEILKSKIDNYEKITCDILLYEVSEIFERGDYEDIKINLTEQGNEKLLTLDVKYNQPVKGLILKGFSEKFYAKADSVFEALKDKPYNAKVLVKKLTEVLKLYRNNNHSLSEIKKVNFDKNTNLLEIEIAEGRIDGIIVEGNYKTDKTIITREIPLSVGEIFDTEKLSRALINLQSSNLFDEVELAIRQSSDKNYLVAKVEEKITGVARFGLRIDNEYSTQIAVDLRDENVLGSGTELGATLKSGLENHSIIFEHKSNRIFDTYLTYKIQGYFHQQEIKVYSPDSMRTRNDGERLEIAKYDRSFLGASIGLGTQVERFGNIFMKVSYERNKISNESNFEDKTSSFNLFLLNLSMHIDSQDKYPFPTRGFNIYTEYESALPVLSSEVSYTKFLFNYRGFFPLWKDHTAFTRFEIGFGDATLPLSKHFSFGGQQSFFGFRDNEYMGRQIFISSLGYRLKLPFKLVVDTYLKFRYDIGSVWSEKEALRLKDMKHGVGASVAIETPIGPAEFSYGHSFTFENGLFKKGVIPGESYFYFTIGYYY